MKNQVIDILEDINPGVDHEARVDLVDSRCIDSLTMIAFVAELEDAFDVEIPPVEIVPDNFNSVEAVCSLMAVSYTHLFGACRSCLFMRS